jgi:hypothetical protein
METAQLGFTTQPTGLTFNQVGNLVWDVSFGNFAATDGAGTWTATSVNQGNLTLQMLSGPSNGKNFDPLSITVVVPDNNCYCVQIPNSNIWHVTTYLTIGIHTNLYLTPKDVSFHFLNFIEGDCKPSVCTGWWSDNQYANYWHRARTEQNWTPKTIQTGNINTGCSVGGATFFDTAAWNDSPPLGPHFPYTHGGQFTWPIPWIYIIPGEAGTWKEIMPQNETFTLSNDATGETTVSKGGASGTNSISGVTQGY